MCAVNADSKIGTAWGVAAAVVGPSIAIGTWFILTWTYRSEKKLITDEVIKRLKASDVCETGSVLQHASTGLGVGYQAKQSKRISAFHPQGLATGPALDDTVRSGSFTSAVSAASDLIPKVTVRDSNGSEGNDEPSPETKKVARQITRRCLRRWDGLLGIRASSNSLGNRAGIWRDRYDTVRCAVLLLAFRKLNKDLQANPGSFRADDPGELHSILLFGCTHAHAGRDPIAQLQAVNMMCCHGKLYCTTKYTVNKYTCTYRVHVQVLTWFVNILGSVTRCK